MCSCTCSKALEYLENSCGAQCAAAKLTISLTGTSFEVQVQAMVCPSAALWQGQLHGIPSPTGQADARGLENISPFSHHSSLLEVTSAGCQLPGRMENPSYHPVSHIQAHIIYYLVPHSEITFISLHLGEVGGLLVYYYWLVSGDFHVNKVTLITDKGAPHPSKRLAES